MEINNDDDGVRYFVGLYCSSDSKSVYLGTFSNERCTTVAPEGTYAKYTYGKTLPYSSESIVGNDCTSCAVPEEDDGNNNGDDADKEVEIQQMCQELYEGAGKCESNLSIDYPSTVACNFIHNVLPQLEKIYRTNTGSSSSSSASASTAFAWIFGITTVGLGVFCYTLLQKLKNLSIDYPSTVACTFINDVLPQLEKIFRSNTGSSSSATSFSSVKASPSTVFAWVFGITAVALGVYVFTLLGKLRRANVNLSDNGGVSA
eukprot:CAMPEP_0195538492 /NCGR_PEP_ID=MMETSP0794_2-20130614/49556_1 /TAXON_ID=515487 /ORGANISM="Stephanopyxis turris, Strain CCMP 815" /LENGTH=259 /DNA_ID=CAMNT_0040672475 /DNA_START=12 /DNA_END=791 /DNA_ORIENTATION=+